MDEENQVVIADGRVEGEYREISVGRGTLRSAVPPGFWIDPSWLWQPDLPNPVQCLAKILESASE